ncbi:molybdopterin-biosynthesis enzyme MoeA-like protein [Paucimonas lemoignei]|uniref:Molybdopterin-biosynthesis enzyme MoeA-like protein n=1 Tax=Paucimonas lemoignei TaxID=29443 RepID=A0A4R3HVP6_PAULE|nr:molybdopterin-binding protein [Paucimonas lemoignei]TCS36633.1 molybdopterin-biosynthesis enzyme MoeA-like protein [Paucimonas lemoignei]
MAFGLIIIGDEILSGRRVDQHFAKVVQLLGERGLLLSWAEYLGDDPERITATLRRTLASGDVVFSCGGIGATPDDRTRQCAAAALGVPLVLHPQAKQLIQERITDMAREAGKTAELDAPENLQRLKMGEFPEGAQLIPNPYNKIPGFSIQGPKMGAHYFVPGFPVMAWPMIEWALDTYYTSLFHKAAHVEYALLAFGAMESALTPLMEEIETRYPSVKVFSLPSVATAESRAFIELGVKGEPEQAASAFSFLQAELDRMNVEYRQT